MQALLFFLFFAFVQPYHAETEEILISDRKIRFRGQELVQDAFFMDRYEVSHAQYHALAQTSNLKPSWFLPRDIKSGGNFPVTGIDWFDAQNYCNQLGKRLPTYREFVVAAFGEWERRFAFGDELPKTAPFRIGLNAPDGPFEVNSYRDLISADGFYNLSGNVAEWLMDAEQDGRMRRVSGGSYASELHQVEVGAYILLSPTENSLPTVGFRCARPARRPTVISETEQIQLLEEKKATTSRMIEDQMRIDEERKLKFLKLVLREELKLRRSQSTSLILTDNLLELPEGALMYRSELKLTQAFSIDTNPVTLREFQSFVNQGYKPGLPLVRVAKRLHESTDSTAKVFYEDARAYCSHRGARLPNAWEWIRAWHHQNPGSEPLVYGEQLSVTGMNRLSDTGMEWLVHAPLSEIPASLATGSYAPGILAATIGPMIEETEIDSHHIRGALVYSRQGFRCVIDLPAKLPFAVNLKDNYFGSAYFEKMEELIEAGENVFQIDHQSLEFEKKMLGINPVSQQSQSPVTVLTDLIRE